MARADLHLVYDARLGKRSQWVYRVMNGKVFFSRRPNPKKQTAAQATTRARFHHVMQHTKAILADPVRRAPYEARAKAEGRPAASVGHLRPDDPGVRRAKDGIAENRGRRADGGGLRTDGG